MTRQQHTDEKLVRGYDRMMERIKTAIERAEKNTWQALQQHINGAIDKAVELGELTREEAEKIGDYLRRDLHDAAAFLAESGADLAGWLRFDMDLIEQRLLEMFAIAADQTKLALMELEEQARVASEYHTGDITSIGSLQCTRCGKIIYFHKTSHIPPCPSCANVTFTRVQKED
jgi:polyhydroxyalkanoate synthesis regulator phasin